VISRTLAASDAPLDIEALDFLVDPNLAFLLLLVGIAGIAIEAFAPGGLLPGLIGVVAFAAGVLGASELTVEAIGVILLLAGAALIVAEAFLPSGIAGAFGVAALSVSGLTIFDTSEGDPGVEPIVVIATAVIVGGLSAFVIQRVIAARRNPILTGEEELPGRTGDVRLALDPIGQVFVEGALWRARPAAGDGPLGVGARVRVESVEGLTLLVSPIETAQASGAASDIEGDR